jgi:exopolyphosphatase/guanosine-5'-triphosphate,3'-diphosphate pyrophosphatase
MTGSSISDRMALNAAEAAVIDVGSNSVRLVVYRLDGRAMTPILNEKVMAGLGRGMGAERRLSRDGVEAAVKALKRFATLIQSLGVNDVFPVATAAVRDAEDGRAFADRVQRETGLKLRILDGAEEARLSALGVMAGAPDAEGVVGDLGGASLELIEIGAGGVGKGETFALGPLSLSREGPFDLERVLRDINASLANSETLKKPGGDFYAVGGAWRALGRIDIALRNHPLGVLHHHEMAREEVLTIADLVRRQSKKSLEKLEEAAAKRADSLPYAALVLERVMQAGGYKRVFLSAFGLREGVLLERMRSDLLTQDPLIAATEALAGRTTRTRAFGAALANWIAPIFSGQAPTFGAERDAILRGAAARLADVGAMFHPDQRVEIMFDMVLRAPLAAISHDERAFLAAAVHHRYAKSAPKHASAYERLLSEEMQRAAITLGSALRLGCDLSGRSESLLAQFSIAVEGDKLVLRTKKAFSHLMTEQSAKRHEAAAQALGLSAQAEFV